MVDAITGALVFREDILCRVEVGAAYTVLESSKVGKGKFAKYQPFDVAIRSLSREPAEEVV